MITCRILALVAAAAIAFVQVPRPARALEGGQSAYLKGFRDFMSGVLPGPGVQLRNDIVYHGGQENARIPQGQLGVNLRSYSDIFSATVITPYRILGGN